VRCRKFTDWARRQARLPARVLIKSSLFAYGFLKVALPSHSDRIADFPEGPSRRSGHSLVRSRTAGIDPVRKFGSEVSMKGVVESPELEGALLHLSYS
jgi:hypothetical protein